MDVLHYDTKQASTPWLLCDAPFAIWGISY